ncbi:DUF1697 domain-containing protein [Paenibacillus sp. JTLBN-2024]
MTIYVVLLRGINVGGHNKIKMAELREVLEKAGCRQVRTYIQSGNVVLASGLDGTSLRELIEREINAAFGLNVQVIIRSKEEFEATIKNCPYDDASLQEGETLHVSMLSGLPSAEGMEKLAAVDRGIDEYTIIGTELYMFVRNKFNESKLADSLGKLGHPRHGEELEDDTKAGEHGSRTAAVIKKAKEFNRRIAWRSFAFLGFSCRATPSATPLKRKLPIPSFPPAC